MQNKIVRARWRNPQQGKLRSDVYAKEAEKKERERERVDERGKSSRYSTHSTRCTKRIQFDGITITGVMSENNEISPNHHGSPGIRSFVPFVPSLTFPLSFFPPLHCELRSSIVYHTRTWRHMDGYAQSDQRKWVEMFSNQSRSRIILLPEKNWRIFKYFGLRKKFCSKVFERGNASHICENSIHFRNILRYIP